jgi:hypothetical protein
MLFRNFSRISRRLTAPRAKLPPPRNASWTVRPFAGLSEQQSLVSWDRTDWNVQAPKKGTGFDNFTPREGNTEEKGGSSSAGAAGTSGDTGEQADHADIPPKSDEKAKEEPSGFSSKDKKDRKEYQSGGESGNADPSRWENWVPALVLLVVAYGLSRRHGDEPADSGPLDREISWHDFLRLLQQQDVVKVVVTDDRSSARVYLKSHAVGLLSRTGVASSPFRTGTSYEERRQRASQDDEEVEHDDFHGQEQERLEGLRSAMPAPNVVAGRSGHTPFFYRMQIGSVEGFERKLDEAQRALKRDPENDVPVQYLPGSVSGSQMSRTRWLLF